MKALKLAKEYRKTMPPDLMHLWAADSVNELRRLAEVNAELTNMLKCLVDADENGELSNDLFIEANRVIAQHEEQQ